MSLILPDDFRPRQVEALSLFLFYFLLLVFGILIGQKKRIAQLFSASAGFLNAYRRLVYRLSIVLIIYITLILSMYYYFNKYPEHFFVAIEVKESRSEFEKREIQQQISVINESQQLLNQEKEELSYLYTEILNFKESDSTKYLQFKYGKRLFMNDSIALSFRPRFQPPGSDPFFEILVFSKTGELIKELFLYGYPEIESLSRRLGEIDKRLSKFDTNTMQLSESSSDFGLDLLSFVYYYLYEQIQPLSRTMQLVDLIGKIMGWAFVAVVASEIISPIFKRQSHDSDTPPLA